MLGDSTHGASFHDLCWPHHFCIGVSRLAHRMCVLASVVMHMRADVLSPVPAERRGLVQSGWVV